MDAARSTRLLIWSVLRWPVAVVAILLFGAGVPWLWLWIGSQLQGGTAPSFGGLGVALIGIAASYAGLAYGLAWAKGRVTPDDGRPVRHDWNRSLSAERRQVAETHPIEDIVIAATILVGIVCTVWFLLFGDPGVRQM